MSRHYNILWLNTDQQMVANRPGAARELPLQKRLAARGMNFRRAYTALPVCSPSRASMLTGHYPHNHGVTENDGRFGGRAGLEPSDTLVTDPLRERGYRCAWFGKWHLHRELDARAFGFEGYGPTGYAYPYASPDYRAYLERNALPDPVARIELSGESGTPPGTEVDLTRAEDWFDFEAGSAILEGPVEAHVVRRLDDGPEVLPEAVDLVRVTRGQEPTGASSGLRGLFRVEGRVGAAAEAVEDPRDEGVGHHGLQAGETARARVQRGGGGLR